MALLVTAMELLDSSSDDDSVSCDLGSDSDEEYNDVCILIACALVRDDANRVPGYESIISRYHEYEFKRLFRLSRETFDDFSAKFRASAFYPNAVQGRQQISAEKTCLIALVYLGSQISMYAIGDKFDVTESSVHACVTRVVHYLHATIMAACVLHNVCNDERDFLEELATLPRDDDVGNDEGEGDFDCSLPGYSQSLREFIAKEQC
ncbi:hypothetical protein HPB50_013129 [Hyalomma asiaticum]|uniref:Uncharacterized protein n=1 Tax=Hyalomma asiaticum TaxID=266040 RepID=A0ACB7TK17_HYAAI|nr:hypothetical protein HPB50_013129 [Hyalomma asiaticum]